MTNKVKITNCETGESYVANSADECKTKTDRAGYQMALQVDETVCSGVMVFTPLMAPCQEVASVRVEGASATVRFTNGRKLACHVDDFNRRMANV